METVFLFGAGASAYSAANQDLPTIGPKLFESLQKANLVPDNISIELQKIFKNNFEAGMYELSQQSNMHYNQLQRNLALYFI